MFSLLQSSAVDSITYRQGEIAVQWKDNPIVYTYPATPDDVYAILSAKSKGKGLNATVKDGRPVLKEIK